MKRIHFYATAVLLVGSTLLLWRITAQSDSTPGMAAPWQQQDVGPTGLKGSALQTAAGWELKGAGADIWGGADSFQFAYVPWEGDVQIIARVLSVEKTDPWAKAGVMIRENLTSTSPHGFIAWTPEKGAAFIRRSEAGRRSRDDAHQAMRMVKRGEKATFQQRGSAGADNAVDAVTSLPTPRWIKLVRQGNTFTAFDAADGVNWEWLGTDSIPLAAKVYVGLAVTSHDSAHLCTAAFEHVNLGQADSSAAIAPRIGSGDGLQGSYFDGTANDQPALQRLDPVVNFDWVYGSPGEGIGRNDFRVRWEGELEAQFTEPYALHVVSDDRARLWINGDPVIDEWYEHGEQMSTAVVNFEAGKRYLIRLDYFEDRGRAMVKLLWSSPSTPQQVIAQSQLYSKITDQDQDGLPDLWELAHGLNPADPADAAQGPKEGASSYRELYQAGFEPLAEGMQRGNWLSRDLGQVGAQGSAEQSKERWTLSGSGADIFANADGFQFLYQPWRGDGQLTARVLTQDNTDPWAKAGIMVRTDLSAGSPHLTLAVTPEHGLVLLKREFTGGPTTQPLVQQASSQPWIRIVRHGSTLVCYTSTDGANWDWLATETLSDQAQLYFGLALCSHDNSKTGSATFDQLVLEKASPSSKPKLTQGTGDGLRASYFDSTTGRVVSRIDPTINFDWDIDSLAEGIGADFFSTRWEGSLQAPSTEEYRLHVISDDGARLWLDDQLLIDSWTDHGASEQSASIRLEAGRRYALKLEHFERTGEAACKLLWSSPSIPKQPVPQVQLYSVPAEIAAGTTSQKDVSPIGAPGVSGGTPQGSAPGIGEESAESPANLNPVLTGNKTIQAVAGSDPMARLGRWEVEGTSIYAVDRRGWLEYELTAPAADIYRIEIEGASHNPFDLDPGFYLVASIDGEYLGRLLLDVPLTRKATVQVLTPWLTPGAHRFRIFWDNARKGRSLQIHAVRLQGLLGPDANSNGVKDWVESKLADENGTERTSDANLTTLHTANSAQLQFSSTVSPACLEGRGGYLSMMKIRLADGGEIQPQHGIGNRWFANVPLSADKATDVHVSFQSGGRIEKCTIAWQSSAADQGAELMVRQGDSLLLAGNQNPEANANVLVNGQSVGSASNPLAFRFTEPGLFSIRAGLENGTEIPGPSVRVVPSRSGPACVAWTGKARVWDCPDLPSEVLLQTDPRLNGQIEALPTGGRRLRLVADEPEDRYAVARLGTIGSVLSASAIHGVNIYGVSESGAFYGEKYDDGSQLVETAVALTRVFPDVRVELRIIVAGVMFEDGTLVKTLRAADFDESGLAIIHFIMPPGVQTSNCHIMRAYQEQSLLGEY